MDHQEYLFEPNYLIDRDHPFDSLPASASERRTEGGEQASESGRGAAGPQGLLNLFIWVHSNPDYYKYIDVWESGNIVCFVQGEKEKPIKRSDIILSEPDGILSCIPFRYNW